MLATAPYGECRHYPNPAFGKQARVIGITKGRYARIVGRLQDDGTDVNRELQ